MTVLFTVVCHINAFIIGEDVCIEFPNTLKTNDLEKHKNLKLILTTGNITLMVFCQSNSPSLALSSNTVILRDWHFQWIPHIVCKNDTYIYIRVCNYAWVCDECKNPTCYAHNGNAHMHIIMRCSSNVMRVSNKSGDHQKALSSASAVKIKNQKCQPAGCLGGKIRSN